MTDRNRILHGLLILQAVVIALVLWYFKKLVLADYTLGGDAPSYLLFPFSSLSEALSSHRTFGLPLILKTYRLLFDNFSLWPTFQLFIYVCSVFFLYWSLIQVRFTKWVAFATATGLLWNPNVVAGMKHIETEVFTAVFILLTTSFLLQAVGSKNRTTLAMLGLSVFFLYQIRPNMAFVVFLVPLWGFAVSRLVCQSQPKQAFAVSFKLLTICLLPLLAFCLLRYIAVGDFGLASFSGTAFSGQATSYLNDRNVKHFEGETRALADEILWRKTRLSPPCHQIDNLSFRDRSDCGNVYAMISWLSAIRQKLGIEPFEDSEKNREPWKHKNLSAFFSINNVEIDSLLKKYSLAMLWQERQNFLPRLAYVYSQAFLFYFKLVLNHFIYLLAAVFLMVSFGAHRIFLSLKKSRSAEGEHTTMGANQIHILGFIAVTLMLFGVLTTGMIIHFDTRYLLTFGLFLLSAILGYAIPPPFRVSHDVR